ncbi:MAG TPA: alpha/beta hydrolase [Povalibacter sp.]|nr:alpha/beta hydrolase [Povalibacter sp.]
MFGALVLHEARANDNHVEVSGKGPDVVLIPGLASAGAAMQPIADDLAKCYRTHTFTLAGFAGQPANPGPQLEGWERSIADYIAHLESGKAIVIGHSLGGFLGLKLAVDHADRVQHLVVLDALPFLPAAMVPGATAEAMRPQADGMRKAITAQPPDAFKAMQQQTLATMTTHAEAVATLVDWSLASDRTAMADAYYEMFTTDLRDSVAAIRTPTLVLVPWDASQRQDAATTLELYRQQYQKLPHAEVKLVKGSRHFLTFDQPIATNWAIEQFVGKCDH